MSLDARKTYKLSLILFVFGFIALYGSEAWLLILVPAALLIWSFCPTKLGTTRN